MKRALLVLILAACSGSDASRGGPLPVVELAELPTSSAPANNSTAPPTAPCAAKLPATCAELVSDTEKSGLQARIDMAQKAVVSSQFQDVDALVELARLQLRRDGVTADSDGSSDAERARKNAMRAVAVDASKPAARLIQALTLARTLRDVKGQSARLALLDLIELALPNASGAGASTSAAIATMKGLIALERGDTAKAKSDLEQSTKLDPTMASAWLGLGDIARTTGSFEDAEKLYARAASLRSGDAGILASIEAAKRREPLAVAVARAVEDATPQLKPGALFNGSVEVVRCSTEARAIKEGDALCKALDRLAAATAQQQSSIAVEVVEAARGLDEACAAKRPACGAHVATAYMAAAHAFSASGTTNKAIATLRMLTSAKNPLPGGKAVTSDAFVVLGDLYFTLGMFDQAADWYERHVEVAGPKKARDAKERVIVVRIALGQARTEPSEDTPEACGPLFGCNTFRLAGESQWSPGARTP